jgi:hypothetical protein
VKGNIIVIVMKPRFEQPAPISREELRRDLSSPNPDITATALISMALYERDWRWAESVCLSALGDDPRRAVKQAALIGLGHLARIHHTLHLEIVVPVVQELLNDPDLGGIAEDALQDIIRFVSTNDSGSLV